MTFPLALHKLFSLDTLDSRFTASAKTPPKELSEASIDPAKSLDPKAAAHDQPFRGVLAQPSKWRTPEFYVYYFCFLTIVPFMFKAVYDISKESDPNYPKFAPLLSQGWIPGRKVDNSDAQYAGFRENIPYMVLVIVLHPLLRKAYDSFWKTNTYTRTPTSSSANDVSTQSTSPSAAADARIGQRVSFDLAFSMIFLFALHGISAFKVLLILYVNYKIATRLPQSYVPAATWVFNIGILFANELCHGYPLAGLASMLLPSTAGASEKRPLSSNWGTWVDVYGGLLPRWEIHFNITVLRLISFNFDYLWSLNQRGSSPIELDSANLSERDRVATPAKPREYTLGNYLAYVLYSPLYLAGPILTFNDYISQCRYPLSSVRDTSRTLLYGLRFLISLACMEVVLHYMYVVAISKAQPTWEVYSPFQLSMLGYFNLHIIWLKLLLPWRFFRFWSLLDGIDPPENMVRCMSDNYSALAFWRGWHRSFNRWIVRYIYIPLGGSGKSKTRAIANFLAVFTFVALWHDINLRLLAWSWLITLFVLPEITMTLLFPAKKWRDRPNAYRVLCSIGAVGNILMMMAANLVGFAVGLDGLQGLVRGIVGSWAGLAFLAAACGALFVGIQVMFEVRESEKRKGINLKC
ncbi:glycerol transporter [Elasticomyces elasticus]|nr:glycerol transporter [Elasticomyces elasticus]